MPTTIVSRNTIKLAAGSSTVDNYYLGHKIALTRVDAFGKKITQTKAIIGYVGSTQIATVEGLWEEDYHPKVGDTYEILPQYPDSRATINPSIQALDYITSTTYGRGLSATKDLRLDTWLSSARVCDSRSDIWVNIPTGTLPTVGDVYTTVSSLWQGTVVQIDGRYVRFTENIGKLTYQWNNWRSYKVGTLVHWRTRLYEVTSEGVKATEPTHTSGDVGGLLLLSSKNITKVSGSGPATLGLAVDGNPIRYMKNGAQQSGYTLYDSDGVDYFRFLGWDVNEQRSVTRHQTNITIDTSLPLFDNMNSMLGHFGGILRYSGDKYELEIEDTEGSISTGVDEPRNITVDHIIGKISITDEGIKNAYNSVTASYNDPANKFEARNVTFFNSEYLKTDRNVPKKGSVTVPGITNYYNARILADKFLNKSRFGLTISMNIAPRGLLLQAGKVIQLQYPRYGWTNKKFRIENLIFNDDCTVDVVATEYDDSFYVISSIVKPPAAGVASPGPAGTTISPPTSLVATNNTNGNEQVSSITLSWTDNPDAISGNVITEIYSSYSRHLYLDVTSITSGTTFTTTQNPHGLVIGQQIIATDDVGGMVANKSYFVKSVTANTFTLSDTKGGATITSFTSLTAPTTIQTATVVGTTVPPTNTYTDVTTEGDGVRIQKYYWVRYKINQQ